MKENSGSLCDRTGGKIMNRVILWFLVLVTFCGSSGMCDISEEANPPFNLTVIVLTMNRPKSLERLLNSLKATDFEYDDDSFDVVFHIDKSTGGLYDQVWSLTEAELSTLEK